MEEQAGKRFNNEPAPEHEGAQPKSHKSAAKSAQQKTIIIAVVAALVGVLLGVLGANVFGGVGGGAIGKTTVQKSELDDTIATYNYNGSHNISIRSVLESTGPIDQAKVKDGQYRVPSADSIMGYARQEIMRQVAEEQKITVTDAEVKEFAKKNMGTDDFKQIASQYGMDEEAAKKLVKQSAITRKLFDKVVKEKTGGSSMPTAPEAPAQPEQGKQNEATKGYAEYIKKIAGKALNDKNSAYSKALAQAGYEGGDTATYIQAQAAYAVSYQTFNQEQSKISSVWTEYLNGILSKSSIKIQTLGA